MKAEFLAGLALAFVLGTGRTVADGSTATVTQKVNDVEKSPHGTTDYSPAGTGTIVRDGEQIKTGSQSRAELALPTATVARMGSNTIYNFSVGDNSIDLQEGDILFCKRKDARTLTIKTAAVTAGITGTTGFVSVQGGRKKVYIFGIIEGHATATAGGTRYSVGSGDILEFTPGGRPFLFAYDIPRFVHSSSLTTKFSGTLPNQSAIEAALDNYRDEVNRGFITPPSHAIDYSGDIPIYANPVYANQPKPNAPPPPPSSSNSLQQSPSGP